MNFLGNLGPGLYAERPQAKVKTMNYRDIPILIRISSFILIRFRIQILISSNGNFWFTHNIQISTLIFSFLLKCIILKRWTNREGSGSGFGFKFEKEHSDRDLAKWLGSATLFLSCWKVSIKSFQNRFPW